MSRRQNHASLYRREDRGTRPDPASAESASPLRLRAELSPDDATGLPWMERTFTEVGRSHEAMARSRCGPRKSSSSLEWLSARLLRPHSHLTESQQSSVIRGLLSYFRHSSVALSAPDSQSGNRTPWEAFCVALLLEDRLCRSPSRVPGVTSAEHQA